MTGSVGTNSIPMPIPEHTLQVLEFPAIRRRVATLTGFSRGRERALELTPSTQRAAVEARLEQTAQARQLLAIHPTFTVGGAHDLRQTAELAARGYRLESQALLLVRDHLRALRRASSTLASLRDDIPSMWAIVAPLDPLDTLENRIADSLDDEGRVLDSASDALAHIRANLRRRRADVQRIMQQLLRSPAKARMLQEPIITERAGRAVVPVKQASRKEFGGIVHDASSSGATLFMEPLAAVSENNAVRELQIEEIAEIERVLRELSAAVGAQRDSIVAGVEGMADLDLAVALAHDAETHDAERPALDPGDGFDLREARHPLLEGDVVPIDLRLEPDGHDPYRAIVITGPNTGGKTVALKTIGLLHCMAACGMHLPVKTGTTVAVYTSLLADIGDEQSIQQSLSTFSSHLRNLVAMLEAAGPRTLVLADELGAGTDPAEGAALAQAIVESLLDSGAAVVVTTHHPDLKAFAVEHPLARNASVEFHVATLRPTYRLILGIPGKSNALEIAERLGLAPDVVERARRHLASDHHDVEAVIAALHAEREATERARHEAEERVRAADDLRADLEERTAALDGEREEVLRRARLQARELVAQARNALRDAIRAAGSDAPDALEPARARVRRVRQRLEPVPSPAAAAPPRAPVEVGVGDRVEVDGFDTTAEVANVGARDVEIVVGNLRTRVPRAAIRRATRPQRPAAARIRRRVRTSAAPLEADVRGQRAADMPELVDQALDRALLRGADMVRIIHGKGTGALRQAVHEHLRDHPAVHDHESAPLNQGGDGVTLVHLRPSA